MNVFGKRFEQVVGEWTIGTNLFNLNSNTLRFKHADNDGQAAVAAFLAQNQRKGARLRLAGRKAQDFKLDFFQGNRGAGCLGGL